MMSPHLNIPEPGIAKPPVVMRFVYARLGDILYSESL